MWYVQNYPYLSDFCLKAYSVSEIVGNLGIWCLGVEEGGIRRSTHAAVQIRSSRAVDDPRLRFPVEFSLFFIKIWTQFLIINNLLSNPPNPNSKTFLILYFSIACPH